MKKIPYKIGILGSVVALIVGLISVYEHFKPIKQHKIRWEYSGPIRVSSTEGLRFLDDPPSGLRILDETTTYEKSNTLPIPVDINVIIITSSNDVPIGKCYIDKNKQPYTLQAQILVSKAFDMNTGKRVVNGCSEALYRNYSIKCCWVE